MSKRSRTQRVEDSKQMLERESEVWLATASADRPHLIPLSLAWDDKAAEVVLCTEAASVTVKNIRDHSSNVRLAIGHTMDVLMIEGIARVVGAVKDNPDTAVMFSERTGWDPQGTDGEWVFLRIKVDRAQAWRNVPEIQGRTVIRDGEWLL